MSDLVQAGDDVGKGSCTEYVLEEPARGLNRLDVGAKDRGTKNNSEALP